MPSPVARHVWWAVLGGYTALAVVMTWPLATRLGTAIAVDIGDPLFEAWVIGWVCEHLTRLLTGDIGAWAEMWNAPIFTPEPATLTYSDHFIAQAVQALPLWWLTANPLAAYNVVYLVTVALTAVAAHGLTARLTGRHLAGFFAALLCTCNEYRTLWTVSHLQVLSIHWWIFGLWGLDVFIERRSRRALAIALASLVALHLSSSYLMAYCAPFTAAFVVWSLSRHGRLRDRAVWTGVLGAGALSVLAVVPILRRYLATRDELAFARTLQELVGNSATLAAYGAALSWLLPFVALAVLGVLAPAEIARLSRRSRSVLLALAGAAFVLALGPVIDVSGWQMPGPYAVLWRHVPGFEGLRVPHRFVAIGAPLLSVLGGIGAAWLWRSRPGRGAVVAALVAVTHYGWPPFPLNWPVAVAEPLALPPAYLLPSADVPRLYRFVAATPRDSVIVEFPFGELPYEIRFTYFTGRHHRRTLNGYSGVLPPSFLDRQITLRAPLADGESAWQAIALATHAVVHTRAWSDDTGAQVKHWLEQHGARVVTSVDGAFLYELRPD